MAKNWGAALRHRSGAVVLGLTAMLAPAAAAHADTLSVAVDGVRTAKGQVLIAVHDKAQGFPSRWQDAVKTARVPAKAGSVSTTFRDLRKGRYAVIVLHDEDGNGVMTMDGGRPIEGFGTSNNPGFIGPPVFDPAAFELSGTESVRIQLRYP
jgi:uncharacterized protein (DUF2141 family)